MSIQNCLQLNNMPSDALVNVFNFLTLKELSCVARVCSEWKNLTTECEIKKNAFSDLMERRIVSRVCNPNSKECYFIASMLKEQLATPRLVSKFIRGEADEPTILKAISIAKTITSEQLTDAFDSNCPHSIIESMLSKMEEAPESAIIAAMRQGKIEILPILLKKSTISPQMLLEKAIGFENYKCVEFILTFYPHLAVTIGDCITMTKSINLPSKIFEFVLKRYFQPGNNKISFRNLDMISHIIDERVSLHRAPHNENTEKIFELTAEGYVQSNQIHSFKLLTDDFDVELFVRNWKHPVMAAKMIQAVEEYSLFNNREVSVLCTLASLDSSSPISWLPQEINRLIVENIIRSS